MATGASSETNRPHTLANFGMRANKGLCTCTREVCTYGKCGETSSSDTTSVVRLFVLSLSLSPPLSLRSRIPDESRIGLPANSRRHARARARTYVHTCRSCRRTDREREETGERAAGEAESRPESTCRRRHRRRRRRRRHRRRRRRRRHYSVRLVSRLAPRYSRRASPREVVSPAAARGATTRGRTSDPADRNCVRRLRAIRALRAAGNPEWQRGGTPGPRKKSVGRTRGGRRRCARLLSPDAASRAFLSSLSLFLSLSPSPFFLSSFSFTSSFSLILCPMSPFNPLRDLVHCSEFSLPPSLPPSSRLYLSFSLSVSFSPLPSARLAVDRKSRARPVILGRRTDYVCRLAVVAVVVKRANRLVVRSFRDTLLAPGGLARRNERKPRRVCVRAVISLGERRPDDGTSGTDGAR